MGFKCTFRNYFQQILTLTTDLRKKYLSLGRSLSLIISSVELGDLNGVRYCVSSSGLPNETFRLVGEDSHSSLDVFLFKLFILAGVLLLPAVGSLQRGGGLV